MVKKKQRNISPSKKIFIIIFATDGEEQISYVWFLTVFIQWRSFHFYLGELSMIFVPCFGMSVNSSFAIYIVTIFEDVFKVVSIVAFIIVEPVP